MGDKMHLTNREKEILTTLVRLKNDCNRLKLPTISAYMQDYYFKRKSDMFLAIFQGKTFLFFKHGLLLETRNDCCYQFMELVFLLQNLLSLKLISLFPCFDEKSIYIMSSESGDLSINKNNPNRINFSPSNHYITWDEKSISMFDEHGKILYDSVEISGEINLFICNVFNSGVFINETLVNFVNNGFMFDEEKISKANLNAAWWGVGVALGIGIVSIIISILSLCCK